MKENNKKTLLNNYRSRKRLIKTRIKEFKKAGKSKGKDIFAELCFCLLTPQSKAVFCDSAIQILKNNGCLYKGTKNSIRKHLKKVRFPNNKAGYIIEARKIIKNGDGINLRSKINLNNPIEAREWLVKNIKGLGYKESSHFLRNIGFGRELAILDVHILRNLIKYRVIKEIPKTINKKRYVEIEQKMKVFSKKIKIPLDELDLLFWSNQTGFIFK